MRFKTKQSGTLKADKFHQAEQILFRFVQTESFPNVSKSIAKSREFSKILKNAIFSIFIEEDGTIRANIDYIAIYRILLTAKHPVVQHLLEKANRDKFMSAQNM